MEISKLEDELKRERIRYEELIQGKEYEANKKELIKLKQENQRIFAAYNQCLVDKNQAERDLDSTIRALHQSKMKEKEQTALAVRKEHATSTELKTKLTKALQHEDSLKTRCTDLEEQLEQVQNQLERSDERNSWYESNHGLTDAVRYQKRLEADIRRRDYDLKQLNHQLGMEIDRRRALSKACELLKEKVEQDFDFDDAEIEMAILCEDNRVQSENTELSRQVEALEGERTKLLSQLRERAIDIGEKGSRFLGMDAHQIAQVMEFASNLRRGVVDLPLNDRSMELLAQISKFKSEREIDKVTIERLEREIFSLSEDVSSPSVREEVVLRQALSDLSTENQRLRKEVDRFTASSDGNDKDKESALTPLMREKAKDIIGEVLVPMPAAAEVQFLSIIKEYERTVHELELLTKSVTRRVESREVSYQMQSTLNPAKSSNRKIVSIDTLSDDKTTSIESHEEHFRRCATTVSDKNKKLLEMMAESERRIRDLQNERDELARLREAKHTNTDLAVAEASVIKLTVKCKALEADLEKETQSRLSIEKDVTESQTAARNIISYLEEWKANAMEVIERQMKSLDATVSMSSYTEALVELDNLKLENALLIDRDADAQVCLLKYRGICRSLGIDDQGLKEDVSDNKIPGANLNDKIKALMTENALLFERTVAYDEREAALKSRLSDAVATCSEVRAKYNDGMTVSELSNLRKANTQLVADLFQAKQSASECKKMADWSASQTSALLTLQGEGSEVKAVTLSQENEKDIRPGNNTHYVQWREQCDRKLREAQRKIEELQNSTRALISLVQRVVHENWSSLCPTANVIAGFDMLFDDNTEIAHVRRSAVSKMTVLITTIEQLQQEACEKESTLNQSSITIEQLNQEKQLLQTKLARFQGKGTDTNDELLQQLMHTKTFALGLKRELRQTQDRNKVIETRNNSLERTNARLESENARAEILSMVHESGKGLLSPFFLVDGINNERDAEAKKMDDSLARATQMLSEEKLLVAKQTNFKLSKRSLAKEKRSDGSISTLGTVGSLRNSSPKRTHFEKDMLEASQLIELKDKEIERCGSIIEELEAKLADAEESYRLLSKESECQKADISTLASRLAAAESFITQHGNRDSDQKQMIMTIQESLEESNEAKDKMKLKLSRLVKERKEIDAKITELEAAIQRANRMLSVARQGRARSEHNLKVEKENLASAQEDIAKLQSEMNDLKAKAAEATNEKLRASKKARIASSKLKELGGQINPENHEKVVSDLEKRVNVLNQTVTSLAKQNSKLRGELAKMKLDKENDSNSLNRRSSLVSRERPVSRAQCKLEEQISLLEQSLSLERKNAVDTRSMLEMYQQRSHKLEQELERNKGEESKYSPEANASAVSKTEVLQGQISTLTKENRSLRNEIKALKTDGTSEGVKLIQAEKFALQKENERLKKQIQSCEIGELDVLSCRSLALNPAALLTRCMVKSSPSMFIEDLKYKVSTNLQYATVLLWDEPHPKPVGCSQPPANPVQRGSTATELD
eukprot:scaffold1012_cov189-Alexandrium_tamarense.AAC.21